MTPTKATPSAWPPLEMLSCPEGRSCPQARLVSAGCEMLLGLNLSFRTAPSGCWLPFPARAVISCKYQLLPPSQFRDCCRLSWVTQGTQVLCSRSRPRTVNFPMTLLSLSFWLMSHIDASRLSVGGRRWVFPSPGVSGSGLLVPLRAGLAKRDRGLRCVSTRFPFPPSA